MKKTILVLIVFAPISLSVYCQNLIVNPSFEDYTQCPNWWSQIDRTEEWSTPTTGTPDYFNACDNGTTASVPTNRPGYQFAQEGEAYTGLYTFTSGLQREYIQSRLKEPLKAGELYCAEMYVSLADQAPYASDLIGMYFSTSNITTANGNQLNYTPQIESGSGDVITDKDGWTKISGSFIASGGEEYVTIGNFFYGTDIEVVSATYSGSPISGSYYYIDNVSIEPQPEVQITGDTIVCSGNKIKFSAKGASHFKWMRSSDLTTILSNDSVFETTLYEATQFTIVGSGICGTDTVIINIFIHETKKINLGNDVFICNVDSFVINTTASFDELLWSTGSNATQTVVKETGNYSIIATDSNGCSSFDTIQVRIATTPKVNLGNDTIICADAYLLSSDYKSYEESYLWSTGDTINEIGISSSGNYSLTISNDCGVDADEIFVNFDCGATIYIPSAFSPDGDGINDVWEISATGVKKYNFKLFNRWGELIFENNSTNPSFWDGTYKGMRAEAGVYVYRIHVEPLYEKEFIRSGAVTLLR